MIYDGDIVYAFMSCLVQKERIWDNIRSEEKLTKITRNKRRQEENEGTGETKNRREKGKEETEEWVRE